MPFDPNKCPCGEDKVDTYVTKPLILLAEFSPEANKMAWDIMPWFILCLGYPDHDDFVEWTKRIWTPIHRVHRLRERWKLPEPDILYDLMAANIAEQQHTDKFDNGYKNFDKVYLENTEGRFLNSSPFRGYTYTRREYFYFLGMLSKELPLTDEERFAPTRPTKLRRPFDYAFIYDQLHECIFGQN